MARKYRKSKRSTRKYVSRSRTKKFNGRRRRKNNPMKHYNARWSTGGPSLGNVSFEAGSDDVAENKAEKIAKEIGLPNTPYTISRTGRTWYVTPERSYNPARAKHLPSCVASHMTFGGHCLNCGLGAPPKGRKPSRVNRIAHLKALGFKFPKKRKK